ncbi:MAG: hypothetical protein IKL80_01050, partial [Clostridia bacterium]|nr:hypothetical protein [Clostridia bacterium]
MFLFAGLYAIVFLLGYRFVNQDRRLCASAEKASLLYPAACGLCAIFLAQLALAVLVPGHRQDIGLFRAWAAFSEEHALWEYYTTDLYVDYPPVYLYVLYGMGCIARLFGVSTSSRLFLLFVKLVPVLFDALTTVFIFRLAKESLGEKKALVLALLSAVNPINILDSTLWGQADSV